MVPQTWILARLFSQVHTCLRLQPSREECLRQDLIRYFASLTLRWQADCWRCTLLKTLYLSSNQRMDHHNLSQSQRCITKSMKVTLVGEYYFFLAVADQNTGTYTQHYGLVQQKFYLHQKRGYVKSFPLPPWKLVWELWMVPAAEVSLKRGKPV